MKNRCLWILLLLGTCAYACSNEDVNPSGEEQNMFASPDFSTEEEMAIRDNFFEKTGIYLIFNDSLSWREVETPSGIWKMWARRSVTIRLWPATSFCMTAT